MFFSKVFLEIITFLEKKFKKVFNKLHIIRDSNTENTIRNIKAIPLLKPSFSVYIWYSAIIQIKENNIRKPYTITFNILKRILLRLLKFSISTPNLL